MSDCKEKSCGGLLVNLDTYYGDAEGLRTDRVCAKCNRYHGCSKAHTSPMAYPAQCPKCKEPNVYIKYKGANPPFCIYCERDQLRSLEEAHLLTIRELASRLESYYKEMDSLEARLTKAKVVLGRAEAELEYDIGDSKSLQRGMIKVRKIITEALTELNGQSSNSTSITPERSSK